jgi:hypothetical protein
VRFVLVFELVLLLHGATVNTIPTLFWTVAHTFARPDLVARLRAEIPDHLCSAASQLGETVQWWRGREERGNSIQKTLSGD